MGLYYLDTSALAKLYVQEAGTQQLLVLTGSSRSHHFAVLNLARVELHSAVRRRQREGDLEAADAERILARFEQHLETKFVRQLVSEPLIDMAISLVERHALRAYDAVQLAGCLALKAASGQDSPIFVCSDHRLVEAAEAEGLVAMNPAAEEQKTRPFRGGPVFSF